MLKRDIVLTQLADVICVIFAAIVNDHLSVSHLQSQHTFKLEYYGSPEGQVKTFCFSVLILSVSPVVFMTWKQFFARKIILIACFPSVAMWRKETAKIRMNYCFLHSWKWVKIIYSKEFNVWIVWKKFSGEIAHMKVSEKIYRKRKKFMENCFLHVWLVCNTYFEHWGLNNIFTTNPPLVSTIPIHKTLQKMKKLTFHPTRKNIIINNVFTCPSRLP